MITQNLGQWFPLRWAAKVMGSEKGTRELPQVMGMSYFLNVYWISGAIITLSFTHHNYFIINFLVSTQSLMNKLQKLIYVKNSIIKWKGKWEIGLPDVKYHRDQRKQICSLTWPRACPTYTWILKILVIVCHQLHCLFHAEDVNSVHISNI